jgi:hypothetical protein
VTVLLIEKSEFGSAKYSSQQDKNAKPPLKIQRALRLKLATTNQPFLIFLRDFMVHIC